MSAESYHFFMKFSAFKGLRNLIIYLGDLEELTIDFSKVKLESIVGLEIYHQSLLEIPSKIFNIFPNLQYLKIYSSSKNSLGDAFPIISLKKLEIFEFNNCINKEILEKLLVLKKKGVKIIKSTKYSNFN